MKLKVTIEGLGKISKGQINLKGITVFAGRNNTGKTFVSKAVYSALKGASSNHAWNLIGREVRLLHSFLARLYEENETPPPVLEELSNLAETPSQFLNFLDKDGVDYAQRVRDIAADIDDVYNGQEREKIITELESKGRFIKPQRAVTMVEEAIDKIKKFTDLSAEDIVHEAVGKKVHKVFRDNFRTRRLSSLAADGDKGFRLHINDCIKISSIRDEFTLSWTSSSEIEDIPSLFYIDGSGHSINGQLIRSFSNMRSRYRMVPDIPAYHTDLLSTIEAVNLLPDEPQEKVITKIAKKIGGKLEYDSGSLHFHEDGVGIHEASVTSSGVLQLGMLGLAVEKGLLREGSFLFIDEPETNLHPTWQSFLTGILAELALKGKINIVLATHSPYIVQSLKYGAKHDDEFDSILSLNHYTDKGINADVDEEMSNHERLERMEEDLNESYIDISLRGMISA